VTRNPVVNAVAAWLYVAIVATLLYYGSAWAGPKDNLLMPIAFLSLFVLSAAVMGYVFLFQPLALYFDGNRSGSVNLFLRTVAVFAAITALLLAAIVVVGRLQA
jgi:hypothetical protein